MKLVTFRIENRDRAGIFVEGDPATREEACVVDLRAAFAWLEVRAGRRADEPALNERYGEGVLGFIENAATARPAADAVALALAAGELPASVAGRAIVHRASEVTLRAPLPRPSSLRDGYAFREHAERARRRRGLPIVPEFDAFPVFYFSNARAIVGPGDVTVQREHLDRLDYELEAAIVVGAGGRNLTAAEADRAAFGMTIMNDWSARGLQLEEMKLNLGPAKGKDFATSLGPWLVTMDELAPRAHRAERRGLVFDMEMRASVNGRPMSLGNLRDMRWTFAQILERASLGADLVAGDVVGSGTCGSGCLLERNGDDAEPDCWLQPGDVVVLEIDGLGRLENRVVLA
ncbi:MAG: fumarylacetoacetate hydrolase family protein [Myxococcales bacterium]|nr:fumarylacetoacetate hydrolase family protein [Myxococcales bacterium]